jgi:hypothetical protein
MSDEGYRIKVEVACFTYDGVKAAFKRMISALERENYRVGYSINASGGSSGVNGAWLTENVSITGPAQTPLTDSEILSLRSLLKDYKLLTPG